MSNLHICISIHNSYTTAYSSIVLLYEIQSVSLLQLLKMGNHKMLGNLVGFFCQLQKVFWANIFSALLQFFRQSFNFFLQIVVPVLQFAMTFLELFICYLCSSNNGCRGVCVIMLCNILMVLFN